MQCQQAKVNDWWGHPHKRKLTESENRADHSDRSSEPDGLAMFADVCNENARGGIPT